MADTDIAVTPDVARKNDDDPDPIDLDRLDASLDDLGLGWGAGAAGGEPDTVGAGRTGGNSRVAGR
jgi:hypothetical protein